MAASERLKTSRKAVTGAEKLLVIFLRDPLSRFTGQMAEKKADYAEEKQSMRVNILWCTF